MNVHQFHSGTAPGDAITDHMLQIQRILRGAGFKSEIYAEHVAAPLRERVHELNRYRGSRGAVLLVHHSLGFAAFERVLSLPDRKVLVYHNITPPEMLEGNPTLQDFARVGRQQLARFHGRVVHSFADSAYNRRDLERLGFEGAEVLPVSFAVRELVEREPDPRTLEELKGAVNLLFVGRIAPNKGQRDLLRLFAYYHRAIEPDSRLLLVGNWHNFPALHAELRAHTASLGLEAAVRFSGQVSPSQLAAHYRAANVFVSMSEHEGFGVPLLESMAFDVPVLAYAAAAVPETLGGAGVLFSEKNLAEVAEMADALVRDRDLRAAVLRRQRERLASFEERRWVPAFVARVRELAEAPSPMAATTKLAAKEPHARPHVQIQGPFETSYSLAIVNRGLALALAESRAVEVSIHATEGPGDYIPRPDDVDRVPQAAALWRRAAELGPPDVVIRNLYPPRVHDAEGRLNLLYFFWEDSLVPREWVERFNRHLDGILVASRHVREALLDSGARVPVAVVGCGLEPARDGGIDPVRTTKRFRFLNVGSAFPRKGIDVLLRAYFEEFTAGEDVVLVLKTFSNVHNDVSRQLDEWRARAPEGPEVVHLEGELDATALQALYRSSHCFVSPTRAEGLGLPLAEAMRIGIPVIVTGYSGVLEFCDDETAFLLPYHLEPSRSHVAVPGAKWAEPSRDALRRAMRLVFESPDAPEVARRVAAARERVEARFSWPQVARRCLDFLDELEATRANPLRLGLVTTWNVRCGIAEYCRHLTEALPPRAVDLRIFADRREDRLADDGPAVHRVWGNGGFAKLDDLESELLEAGLDAVHVHFNFGFFELGRFARLLERLRRRGTPAFVTFHSTADHVIDGRLVTLRSVAPELRRTAGILVHTEEDVDRLRAMGVDHVRRVAHGQVSAPDEESDRLRSELGITARPVIAGFGFLLPPKGILPMLDALHRLRARYPDLLYLGVHAVHPDPSSLRHREECLAAIRRLKLERHVHLVTDFLPVDEVLTLLHLSDAIVMPYTESRESCSGALALALSARRPVVTTALPVFADAARETLQIASAEPDLIAEGVTRVLEDGALAAELVGRAAARGRETSWMNVAALHLAAYRAARSPRGGPAAGSSRPTVDPAAASPRAREDRASG